MKTLIIVGGRRQGKREAKRIASIREAKALMRDYRKIDAIKVLRRADPDLGLVEALRLVESW